MVLPRLGVEALETLKGEFSPDGSVFADRGGGRMSLAIVLIRLPLVESAPEGIRTPNLLIRSQMLYPLSYGRLSSVVWRRREDLNLRSPLRATTH